MRVFARRERPHPGAQLTLFEADDGWRYSLWATNRPADTRGWLGQPAYIDVAHRVQARVEDAIRTGKDAGLGHFPSFISSHPPPVFDVHDATAIRRAARGGRGYLALSITQMTGGFGARAACGDAVGCGVMDGSGR